MAKIIIAGSRHFTDYSFLVRKVEELNLNITQVLCGECYGADLLGKEWAMSKGIPVESYPADWDKYGKKAGYLRNKEMSVHGDELIAFYREGSKGTEIMIDLMQRANKPVHIIYI